jgi:hypothetical protein
MGSALIPKLLGTYERELHPLLGALLGCTYNSVVNLGCAEGYYAVGLALRWPGLSVHAFDQDWAAEALCGELARANGVAKRLRFHRPCTPEALAAVLVPGSFVICDCEGGEVALLDPARVPNLAACDMLVELHDCHDPTISPALLHRFSATHGVQIVEAEERNVGEFDSVIAAIEPNGAPAAWRPWLAEISPDEKALALSEFRLPGMRWAYLSAHAGKRAVPGRATARLGSARPVGPR